MNEKTNSEIVEIMWEQFTNLGKYEKNIIDTTNLNETEVVDVTKNKISSCGILLD